MENSSSIPSKPGGRVLRSGAAAQYRKEKRFAFVSLTPILLLFGLFAFAPIAWSLILSFYKFSPLADQSPFVGLDNYVRLFHDAIFLKSLWVTFKFVAFTVVVNIAITLLIALGIHRVRSRRLRSVFRTVFFLPAIAPLSGSAVVWGTMFSDHGLFNLVLSKLHIPPVHWLSDPNYALLSVIVMTLWADIGYNIVLFMAGLDSIPDMYYEAATLDGASRWHMFRHITLPLLSRSTLFVTVTTVVSYFQAFPQFQVMTKGEPFNETRVLALNIYDQAFGNSNMGYASAMAAVFLLIILLVTLLQLRWGRSQWEH
ncbi:carbohydrate ABC transporter permease [Paenibacillus ehimensis]|uniref:Sugar ABC transporter permease n=1 Tax=Paenibacillus ehimensis TaxID=79264 RepID=A0ABT8VBF4_9BACL|nr:sugar ABC transporter permease [Paenibacillus ehimensis]MDO3678317.1 sugar ABC transporter permease [Paenibacillus ehimensis]MEC0210360.1 sugar ABC transporter permease [Paenibacillus ehimensis]